LKAMPPLDVKNVVRGQYRGYRTEKSVATDSKVETFAALRLEINSWRWQGVPFYLRVGKGMPVTCAEVLVRLRQAPTLYDSQARKPNTLRLRISPDVTIAVGVMILAPGEEMAGQAVEMLVCHHPQAGEMEAYERLLGDAMAGDTTLFAREDYVEEAWRIVDPALKANTPGYVYEPGTSGAAEVDQRVSPAGGWHDPTTDEACLDALHAAP